MRSAHPRSGWLIFLAAPGLLVSVPLTLGLRRGLHVSGPSAGKSEGQHEIRRAVENSGSR
jgi:hypothetical protein